MNTKTAVDTETSIRTFESDSERPVGESFLRCIRVATFHRLWTISKAGTILPFCFRISSLGLAQHHRHQFQFVGGRRFIGVFKEDLSQTVIIMFFVAHIP